MKVDVTKNFFRFRQFPPTKCGLMRMKSLSGHGIPKGTKAVACCPKGKSSGDHCKAGMKFQSILVPRDVGMARARRVAGIFAR